MHCCVPWCTNYSAKTSMSSHKIPSPLDIQKTGTAGSKRGKHLPLKNCHSEHFEEVCFESETDIRKELLGKKSVGTTEL